MTEKICNHCLVSKSLDCFSKGRYTCKPCRSIAEKSHNKERYNKAKEAKDNQVFNKIMRNWIPI